ncbi:putative bromodomain associated protein [Phaeoacremonium minimum UCRPA7]|uniref:Transcription initiation factor TFIID subunit 8 n=1 Tax=Phaeoacremonium minimum (strain UCR-PA7) TaxID=1286976 RepID=R8BJT0_PHAM7|nr:putative bromodomain associated protein [Phaeoacremonium minimum UCRPA7]EON99472.1 putative bromodomain associated protein [Phaeoacremonium minimum UCRPA7]
MSDMAVDSPPRKRLSPDSDDVPVAIKRQRTNSTHTVAPIPDVEKTARKPALPTFNEQSRMGIRRGIVLALNHVGFDTATDEALESFTQMTETYITSIMENVKVLANASRRTQPIPTDFEATLQAFNLDQSHLKPHTRPPIPKRDLKPVYSTQLFLDGGDVLDLPCLDEELSGKPDKDAKIFIPKSFPDFPSIHTYKYTPTDVESVTVHKSIAEEKEGTAKKNIPDWRGDPKKIREAAAREAKQAEEALRGLVRASKIANLKDLRSVAERNSNSKERYELWEAAMRDLLEESGAVHGAPKGAMGSGAARVEIADHSMIVNSQKKFHRREIPRTAKRLVGKG